jgi:hypothetical protein
MFFWKKDKETLVDAILCLSNEVEALRKRIERMEQPAPYGYKKDGTPKSKPGRKRQELV